MRVLFYWEDISGYMAACWTALQRLGVCVKVVTPLRRSDGNARYDADVAAGIDVVSYRSGRTDQRQFVHDYGADIVVISGWNRRAYRNLAVALHGALPIVLAMDNPFRGDLRQQIGRIALQRVLRCYAAVSVPGERGRAFARFLGFRESAIYNNLYGIANGSSVPERGLPGSPTSGAGGPKGFIFVGQYSRRKGIDVLLDAFREYRSRSTDPWPLYTCGAGPYSEHLTEAAGVQNLGFVQPRHLGEAFGRASVLVLPSRYDAWGVVVAEACAAGLAVIATNACGSSVELVRTPANGLVVQSGDVGELVSALEWFDRHPHCLADMGRLSRNLAEPYLARRWAEQWQRMLAKVCDG